MVDYYPQIVYKTCILDVVYFPLRVVSIASIRSTSVARYQLASIPRGHSRAGRGSGTHEFGYHDQIHMVREFQSLGGASPNGTLLELGVSSSNR